VLTAGSRHIVQPWARGLSNRVDRLPESVRAEAVGDLGPWTRFPWGFWVAGEGRDRVVCLDDGAGMVTLRLSYLFPWVCGVFPDAESAGFCKALAGADGRDNVLAVAARGGLPLASEAADVVAVRDLGDFARRCGASGSAGEALVREMRRVLRPGGLIYVGMTRMQSLKRGRAAPAGDLRPLTPARVRRAAGLPEVDRLHLYPTLYEPQLMTELGNHAATPARLRRLVAGMTRPQGYGLLLSDDRRAAARSAIRTLDPEGTGRPGHGSGHARAYVGSGGVLVLVLDGVIVRVPGTGEAVERCRSNHVTLRDLAGKVSVAVPEPIQERAFRDQVYFVETRLKGHEPPLRDKDPKRARALAEHAMEIVTGLHAGTASTVTVDRNRFAALVGNRLDRLAAPVRSPEPELTRMRDLLAEGLLGTRLRVVRTHGDFKRTNLLLDGAGRISGVVDWDLSQPDGPPLVDPALFLAYERYLSGSDRVALTLCRFLFEGGAEADPLMAAYTERLGLGDPAVRRLLGLLAVVHTLHDHTQGVNHADPAWREFTLLPVLKAALAHFPQRGVAAQ
jgi:aminoglycoside phosphotransferase (APT) family kinase protein/SAM-dependent methyltransferase